MEDKISKSILLGITFIFINLLFVSASGFGYDNPNLPNVPTPEVTIVTFQNNTGGVNTSVYWDGLGSWNATQMENSGGVLNILVNWLE